MLRLLASVVVAASLAFTSPASAQHAVAQQLGEARELVQQARFNDAVRAATALLLRTDLSASQRNAALEVLAVAQLANRQQVPANETLRTLYSRDPNHRLEDPDASPPVLSAFARAREAQPPSVPVTLDHETPVLTRREPPTLSVRIMEGADAVAEVRLLYRLAGEGESRVVMTPQEDGSYSARIPVVGDASRATDVAYHLIALAPSLAPLAAIGSPAEPLQLRIPAEARDISTIATDGPAPVAPPPRGGSVVEEWWFWTLVVALVAGGATAAILLGPVQDGPDEGTLGSVRLSLTLP